MEQPANKPSYLIRSESIGFIFPAVWSLIALIWGILFHEVSGAIFISVTSFLFVWLTYKLASFFFSFQQHSGIISNRLYDQIVKFVWFLSAFGFLVSIVSAMLFQPESHIYYRVVFSIVSFGFLLASSRKWGCYYVAK